MKVLTTRELAQELAGGDYFIRTANNVVKGLAITLEKNPDAPKTIIVGAGPRISAKAELFFQQQEYVPVYIKQAVNAWRYVGDFKAHDYSTDPEVIAQHRKHRSLASIAGILFLSPNLEMSV